MNGELEVGEGEAEGLPRAIGHGEGLIVVGGESLKTGSVGPSGECSVDNREDDGAFAVDKGLEGNRELGVGLFQD